jgi:hypothetical protein
MNYVISAARNWITHSDFHNMFHFSVVKHFCALTDHRKILQQVWLQIKF